MVPNRLPAMGLGIAGALFFSLTFVVNQVMSQHGSWAWTASLRYFWTVPIFVVIVGLRGHTGLLWTDLRRHWGRWIWHGSIGFGLFYAPLTWAASYGPAWLIASTFQITIVAGMLIGPWVGTGKHRLTRRVWITSAIILIGVFFINWPVDGFSSKSLWAAGPVLLSGFAYPAGNRMNLAHYGDQLDTYQRILGMTLGSLPVWFALSGWAYATHGWPNRTLLEGTLMVAVGSGLIATTLFYSATHRMRRDPSGLAAVEATQAGEILFAVLGGVWVSANAWPHRLAWIGMMLVIVGLVFHSLGEMRTRTDLSHISPP